MPAALRVASVYLFTPDDVDRTRAHHQATVQDGEVDPKRIGTLGEIAFENFCREFLPTETWTWVNEEDVRRCNPETFAGHDFELFGYEVDVKTSRDVSAFRPDRLLETDGDDEIVVVVWHRDNEDGLVLLGWERIETLRSKVESENRFSGESPPKLDHLAVRPMNELLDLGPNTAHMNERPENPFSPGDRVRKADEADGDLGVVVAVLPPEKGVELYGSAVEGEVVEVAYPSSLAQGAGDWRDIDPALLASYCDDQGVQVYSYRPENLAFG